MYTFGLRAYRWICKNVTNFVLVYFNFTMKKKILVLARFWHIFISSDISIQCKILEKLHQEFPEGDCRLTSTGVLQYITAQNVYYIPCGNHSLKSLSHNFNNWELIKNSNYSQVVEYEIEITEYKNITFYKAEKLYSSVDVDSAEHLLKLLKGKFALDQFSNYNFSAIYDFYRNYCNLTAKEISLLSPRKEAGMIGPTHGDFHSLNIMETKNGTPVIIDLDRFTFTGAQIIDHMHLYFTSRETRRRPWLQLLIDNFRNDNDKGLKWSKNSLLGYLCLRISVEISSQSTPQKIYINHIKRQLNNLIYIIQKTEDNEFL